MSIGNAQGRRSTSRPLARHFFRGQFIYYICKLSNGVRPPPPVNRVCKVLVNNNLR